MKIRMTKKGMERWAQPEDVERFTEAGWSAESLPVSKVIEPEEVINLKAPKTVKSKGTVNISLDNAIESKGD
jgi:hypothetical protein